MQLSILQMALIILFAFFSQIDSVTTFIGFNRPLFAGAVTGLIVGDLALGLEVGATLQLMILGVGSYGGASIPDFLTGAIIGTVYAHLSGKGIEFALALAVPVGLLMVNLDVLARFTNTFFLHRIDRCIEKGDTRGVERNTLLGILPWGLSRSIPVAIMIIFGRGFVDTLIKNIPDWLMGGFKVAGGLLPVVGIAVLLRYLPTRKYVSYLIVGFFLAAYIKVPMLGVAMLGAALAINYFNNGGSQPKQEASVAMAGGATVSSGEVDDDEYEED